MDDMEESEGGGIPYFLQDPSGTLRRRWRWMLLALVVGLSAATAFVAQQEPLYAATATVLITRQQIRQDLVRSTVQEDSFARIDGLINSLMSRAKLSALMDEFGLYPELHESLERSEIAAEMRAHISIRDLSDRKRGSQNSARVYALTFEHPQPKVAAEVANRLASLFTNESIRMRTQQASLATRFLKAELGRAERALREQNAAIRKFKERHRGELPGELESNLMKLERLQQQRQSLAFQIAEAQNRIVLLSGRGAAPFTGEAPRVLASPEQRLFAARAELAAELIEYTEEHPSVIRLRRSIERLEADLAAAPKMDAKEDPLPAAMPGADRYALDQLREQLASTEKTLGELDVRVSHTPARREALEALEERETILRENYLNFLRKVQQAELAESLEAAQQGARFSIADQAEPPSRPTTTRLMDLLMGVLASFGLAAGTGLLLEALDPVLVSKDQIATISDRPVLGSAPRLA
jgi:uncharacterized protein involved in exopolysaccharide biosynthesis